MCCLLFVVCCLLFVGGATDVGVGIGVGVVAAAALKSTNPFPACHCDTYDTLLYFVFAAGALFRQLLHLALIPLLCCCCCIPSAPHGMHAAGKTFIHSHVY